MEGLFTINSLFTLAMLVLLQVVLGFDNLLYISLESKKAPADRQSYVRKLGVGMAIVLRIVLLFVLMSVIQYFQDPFASLHGNNIVEFSFNIHSLIVLLGGAFIMYTAVKEIWHMMNLDEHVETDKSRSSVGKIIFWIVIMNLVFSFDSILSAMALTSGMEFKAQMILMSIAIISGGVLMIVLADKVSDFLQKNRMYEVLGLFILLIVGVMLLSEGGHLAHLGGALFGSLFMLNQQGRLNLALLQSIKNPFKPKFKVMDERDILRTPKEKVKTEASTPHRAGSGKNSKPRQEEIDAILDKINQSGYPSLTKEEKDLLFRASDK